MTRSLVRSTLCSEKSKISYAIIKYSFLFRSTKILHSRTSVFGLDRGGFRSPFCSTIMIPKSSNSRASVTRFRWSVLRSSRRLKRRRMDRAWAGSPGMGSDWSRAATCQSTLKETSVNAYTDKDSWSGSIAEDEVSTRWNRIGHGSNAFFPYSCFNPSRSRGKMLIFFEARGSSFSFEILGIGWKRKLVDLSSSWNWRYDRADPGIAAPILAPYHICIRVRRGRLSINSRWGFFWVPERFEFFPFLFCLFSLFFSLLGQESGWWWCRRLWSMVIMSLGIFHGSMIDSFEEFFSFFNGQK